MEFFNKLHRMKDDLHSQEMENMKSAIARMESKKKRRDSRDTEGKRQYRKRYDELMPTSRTFQINDLVSFQRLKGNRLFELKDELVRPWSMDGSTKDTERLVGNGSLGKNSSHRASGKETFLLRRGNGTPGISKKMDVFKTTDNAIARIATNMFDFDSERSYNFIRNPDHLPSIPGVGHRASISHKNRLKAMTGEFYFREGSNAMKGEKTRSQKASLSAPLRFTEATNAKKDSRVKKKQPAELQFDVRPSDKDVFKNLNGEFLLPTSLTPVPPFNSRTADALATCVPVVILPEAASTVQKSYKDSTRNGGELNNAMKKLVTAQEDLANLKEELESIAHLNENLEKSDTESSS